MDVDAQAPPADGDLILVSEHHRFCKRRLQAIGGALTIIQRRTGKDPLIDQSINIIHEEIKRLNNFVKECLDFSAPHDPLKYGLTDINDIISSSLDLMLPVLQDPDKIIAVNVNLQQSLPKINANFNEIKQVVLNLIKNSMDAIHENGQDNHPHKL